MEKTPDSFSARAQEYAEYLTTPWGIMRDEMIKRQLALHWPKEALRILDLGCGPGHLAIHLAELGHDVVGVDISPGMIRLAKERAAEGPSNPLFLECDLLEVPQQLPVESFDAVICHCVLEYTRDPGLALGIAGDMLKDEGHCSLLVHNPIGRAIKTAIIEQDPRAAVAILGGGHHVSQVLSTQMHLYDGTVIASLLEHARFALTEYYGVRAFIDLIADNERKSEADFFEHLLDLEMAVCNRSPFRDIAVFHHYVGRKN